MNQNDRDPFEKNLARVAQDFEYPPTPKIAGRVRAKLDATHARVALPWKPAVAILLLALLVAFSVPVVRAGLVDFIQVGIVRIFPGIGPNSAHTATAPAPTPITNPLLALDGKTTLEDARTKSLFPVLVPSYPSDLGPPDLVYRQDRADMVILVWLSPADPHTVRMSLHEIGPHSVVLKKMDTKVVQETSVGGRYALWTTGPYMVQVIGDNFDFVRLVDGHVLIWAMGDITYRLETGLSLEEAVKIAESLH
jgi:hypothetical protein